MAGAAAAAATAVEGSKFGRAYKGSRVLVRIWRRGSEARRAPFHLFHHARTRPTTLALKTANLEMADQLQAAFEQTRSLVRAQPVVATVTVAFAVRITLDALMDLSKATLTLISFLPSLPPSLPPSLSLSGAHWFR